MIFKICQHKGSLTLALSSEYCKLEKFVFVIHRVCQEENADREGEIGETGTGFVRTLA